MSTRTDIDVTTDDDPGRRFDVFAAGAVLWRPAGSGAGLEIAVVHRERYDDWSLPKGKRERRERLPATAVREVAEETGYTAWLGSRLGTVEYRVPQGEKQVHYWSGRAVGGEFVPNSEVDTLRWLPVDEAGTLLTYDHDRDVIGRFARLGPPPTPLLLVRHAKAADRAEWSDEDYLRPLAAKGHRQAEALAGLLALFGPRRVYTAPPVRCRETVTPAAERLGLEVVPEPLLGEDGYWADPDAGRDRLRALAAGPGVAVVCSQGGVIPDVVAWLTGDPEPPARKASTWALGFGDDRLVTADHYPPPTS